MVHFAGVVVRLVIARIVLIECVASRSEFKILKVAPEKQQKKRRKGEEKKSIKGKWWTRTKSLKSTLICSTFACQMLSKKARSDPRMPKRSVVKLNDI
jgi:hypothetical protein